MAGSKPLTKKKSIILITVVFLVLTTMRIGWILYFQGPDHPYAEKGKIDFSEWEFTNDQTISLDGEWAFFPNEMIDPSSIHSHKPSHFISVPGDWQQTMPATEEGNTYGYGTYYLQIILPKSPSSYGLRVNEIVSAAHLYVNGELTGEHGYPHPSADHAKGDYGPFYVLFSNDQETVDLVLHVSNYDLPTTGGISKSIKIGTNHAIIHENQRAFTLQTMVFVIYLLHSLYAFFLYYISKGFYQRELFFYGLMLIIAGFVVLIDDDIVLYLPISVVSHLKLLGFLFITTLVTIVTSVKYMFQINSPLYKRILILYVILTSCIIFVPFDYIYFLAVGGILIYLTSFYYLFSQTIKIIQKGHPDGIYILLFITGYTSNMVWGALINFRLVDIPYYPFDFIVYVVAIACLLLTRHLRMLQLNQEQTAKLQEADQKKDEFLANTSHELRNPLHGIINIAQGILNDDTDSLSSKNREYLQLLVQIGQRMAFTLNDLLDITRLEEKTIQLKQKTLHIQPIVAGVIDMLQFMTTEKKIQFSVRIPPNFPAIYADENRLIQILYNLIHNAIKFTHKGTITIKAIVEDKTAVISVQDTGIGMSAKTIRTIFDPYEQGNEDHTLANTGIGLGLHICKQLVELHGGKISAASKQGKGSIFSFTIPLSNEADFQLAQQEIAATAVRTSIEEWNIHTEPIDGAKSTVLVVDDEAINVKVVTNMLSSHFHVLQAYSGKEALTIIQTKEVDLVVSDVMMPEMSGYTLTKEIRKDYSLSELPILLLTARHQIEDIKAGFLAGANDYVAKPVDAFELQARVQALTSLKQSVHKQLRFEAAWLQAQIKPHFLFNTLNTIASLGEIDTQRMIRLIGEFGNYLRTSFAIYNTDDLINIQDELSLIESYLYIEKERFGDRLTIHWDIETNEDLQVPPLSIQTLVENAVNHGVLKKVFGGNIWIQITKQADHYQITIKDDGIGMSSEEVNELLSDGDVHEGIGISNTNHRLKKLYNTSLKIESEPNVGTAVSFQIPIEM